MSSPSLSKVCEASEEKLISKASALMSNVVYGNTDASVYVPGRVWS